MENLYSPLSTPSITNATTNDATTNCTTLKTSSSHLPAALSYPSTSSSSSTPPSHIPQIQQAYPLDPAGHHSPPSSFSLYPCCSTTQNGIDTQRSWLLQPNGLSIEQEKRVLDAYNTKVARNKRKLARQKSLCKSSSSSVSSIHADTRRLAFNVQESQSTINRDLYKFSTPDNKKLRVLLRKELKNSDVGSLGRIVLPKRETEENLPILSDKEGILVVIRDVYSKKEWSLKFKYWSNNKSRMYVLENTGDFVKQNGLEIGDSLTLYEDESKKLYFSIKKVESQDQAEQSTNKNCIYIPHTYQARDEEEAALALLIEQLKHKEQQEEVNSLVTWSVDVAPSSYSRHKEEEKINYGGFNNVTSISIYPQAATALQPSSSMRVIDDHYFDDLYTGLDLLPDVNRYNFSL